MDPNDYRFTQVPLTDIYDGPTGKKVVASVFLGEWMKMLPQKNLKSKRACVHFRGGTGWVETDCIGTKRQLEVYFIDVGQGDSILIQTPDDQRVLIDGGPGSEALKFLENKYRLDKPDNYIDFEAIISTHSDADHAAGLIKVLLHPKIGVKRFYHNGLFPQIFRKKGSRVEGLVDWPTGSNLQPLMQELAGALAKAGKNLPLVIAEIQNHRPWAGASMPPGGFVCQRADASMGYIPPFENGANILLKVLWPQAAHDSYAWYIDDGKTKNGNSVVVMLEHGVNKVLLAGDLNAASMADVVAKYGPALDATAYKAAHHGSQDYDLSFLRAVAPNVAVISSGDDMYSQYGHPRAVLLGTITKYSKVDEPGVFSSELAACFTPLKGKDLKNFKSYQGQLYEKSIEGIIHLRSDAKSMCVGRVYGRAMTSGPNAPGNWKWDVWPR